MCLLKISTRFTPPCFVSSITSDLYRAFQQQLTISDGNK